MTFDFFNSECKEPYRKDIYFGICDDQNSTKAYTDIDDSSKWIAKVKNSSEKEISFVAIDNCQKIFKEDSREIESTCDGMLVFKDGLFLVELKNKRSRGFSIGKDQLSNTINIMKNFHYLDDVKYKKAYICNKKHPNFAILESSVKRDFFDKTGFILESLTEIII